MFLPSADPRFTYTRHNIHLAILYKSQNISVDFTDSLLNRLFSCHNALACTNSGLQRRAMRQETEERQSEDTESQ